MHPSISQALASEHIEDARRLASEQRRVAEVTGDTHRAGRRGFSRYFGHAREGHISHFVGRVGELAELELAPA